NESKAYISGLIHDIGKELSDNEILDFSESFRKRNIVDIKYWDFKITIPFLLHGVASAEIMVRDLKINDIDLLSAAISHTTGGTNLDKLSKFTYIADFCEPTRKHKEAKIIERLITKKYDFDRAYFMTYRFVLSDLTKRMVKICPESVDGYNEALSLCLNP
ncbi:MAG TPA: hypothetical protein PK771_12940, partial [Spirochaetota bacterium]|nr:hypothetical protein [Spirochaetota bacterium]